LGQQVQRFGLGDLDPGFDEPPQRSHGIDRIGLEVGLPRKPSSVFVIVAPQAVQTGQAQSSAQAYRYRLDDNTTVEQIVERNFQSHPAGTEIFVVEDTKVDGFTVGVQLNPIDDPRLQEDAGG
jgi:hypothetical protein